MPASFSVAAALLAAPLGLGAVPGPHPSCPSDMRLVAGTHYDEVSHLCLDAKTSGKATHCFAYAEDFTLAEGEATPIRVCMDQFEAPNARGALPLVMRSFDDAVRFCQAKHKRVCTEQEWELACEGDTFRPWVYGWKNDLTRCNSAKAWRPFDPVKLYSHGPQAAEELDRLWQGAPSGAFVGCAAPSGVFDLMGNIEEWVASRNGRKFPGALMGGFWAKPWTGCRGTNDAHEPSFTFYETGFRCCSDPIETARTQATGPR
jgi:formylglycine-generating enzyme required for sulfatase activity